MNLFHIQALVVVLHEIESAETACMMQKLLGQGHMSLDASVREQAEKCLQYSERFFTRYPLVRCIDHTKKAKEQWNRAAMDASAANELFHRLVVDIIAELKQVTVLTIASDRMGLIDRDNLFGDEVKNAFGSATGDITEAGNCLASECTTASVFHLMRTAEVGLRALAMDRKISFANKPIDQQEWGTILSALESVLTDMRAQSIKKWPAPETKDTQTRFYGEVIQELRGFNEAWRRHLSHARQDGIYDRDYAASVMGHVKKFMQKLATKISETSITSEYW